MYKFLTRRVTSPALDDRLGWVVAFVFLVVCTTLVLEMLPTLGLLTSAVLFLCVSTGWLVIGWEARSLFRRPTTEVTTARREPRGEVRVAAVAAPPLESAPATKVAPRVWTVFAAYGGALIGSVIVQALVAFVFVVGQLADGADIGQLTTRLRAVVLTPEGVIIFGLSGQLVIGWRL
jgi:hypothetical protein